MHGEIEQAVPAELPYECIKSWGQVVQRGTRHYVPNGNWVQNPQYNAIICGTFWGK